MSDELLQHYERELRFLRELAAEFGERHPKVATRLRIAGENVEDPHVRRLLEGVAFLNARVRRKLDDEFPELSLGLLSILQPHLLSPIPSMSVVQLVAKSDLGGAHLVPRGTLLETEPVDGTRCRFQTVYPVEAWPAQVVSTRLMATPFRAPATPRSEEAAAVLEIALQCSDPQARFAEIAPGRLRFHVQLPPQHAGTLYELVLNDALELAAAASPRDASPSVLPISSVRAVGFEPDEGLLPYSSQSSLGYRLLSEFFVFPEKFLFFEVDLSAADLSRAGRELWIYVYARRHPRDLEAALDKETADRAGRSLLLNCTPIVNLFPQLADPIELDRSRHELVVIPDAYRRTAFEVWSIDRVRAIVSEEREVPCLPFFGVDRFAGAGREAVWWTASRRRAAADGSVDAARDGPTEVWLSLVEHGVLAEERNVTLEVRTTCTNRELPKALPYGNDRPRFSFASGGGPIERIVCCKKPTDPLRSLPGDQALWSLVSHLSLNHMSLADGARGPEALKEVLGAYDALGSNANRLAIDSVTSISSRLRPLRIRVEGKSALVLGTEITLALDADKARAKGAFLFASVLERFFALYAPVNSFVELVLRCHDREGEVRRWPPRAGDRCLI